MMGRNPARRLRIGKGSRPPAVLWTEAREREFAEGGVKPAVVVWEIRHVVRFLTALRDDPLFALWWLVAVRGPRRGELAGLRWQDVDFVANEFTIREQVIVVDGVEHLGPPKSAAGYRTVAFDVFTRAVLLALRARQQADGRLGRNPRGRVFLRADGKPVKPDWLTRRFAKLVKDLRLPPTRLHDLRHFAASLMKASGCDLQEIQQALGHHTIVTTADTYVTLFKEVIHTAADKTAELLLSQARFRLHLEGAAQA
jgi:integrase